MIQDELILCSPRTTLPPHWLPQNGCVLLSESELLRALLPQSPIWLPRSLAENDPTHKQWIPYTLLRSSNGHLACYPRHGSEARLHGLHSLGLGGHINNGDAPTPFDWMQTFKNGLSRELHEEFPAASTGQLQFLGLINEDDSLVGRVHLGLVFICRIEAELTPPTGELAGLTWQTPANAQKLSLETWSHLALELLATP